jgi:hypothetical protein
VVSVNHTGSAWVEPYTSVDDFTTTLPTQLSGWLAAANRFMVPMTLISCIRDDDTDDESTSRKLWTIVSTWVARTMRDRIE